MLLEDTIRVLLVEDNPGDARLVETYLNQAVTPFKLTLGSSAAEGLEFLENYDYDVVLLDLSLPDSDHDKTLDRFLPSLQGKPLIILTGDTDAETAIDSVRRGAQDFLSKNVLNPGILERVIHYSIEREMLHRSLRESEDRYRSLVENSAEAIIGADTEMKISVWNRAAERLFGYERSEIVGESLLKLVPEKMHGMKIKGYEQFVESGKGKVLAGVQELRALRKDGTTFPVECSIAPIKQKDGWTATAIIRDISERKELERQKRRIAKEMSNMQRMDALGMLAGGIAHDFNNILTTILGNISLIRGNCSCDKELTQIQQAEDAAIQAKKLAGQLLTFSEGGKPVKSAQKLAPHVRRGIDFALAGSGCGSQMNLREDLVANMDGWQISQVISNLVINATQAMNNSGTVRITMSRVELPSEAVSALPAGKYALIQVEDSGAGIPQNRINRIFEPFYTSKDKGHGLGLSVCFSIVQNHGGAIDVESQEGKGTTFSVYIPLTETEGRKEPGKGMKQEKLRSMSILIMDDEDSVRGILKSMLVHLGMDVTETVDGMELIKAYQKGMEEDHPFDLVITDLTVPGGMGGEMAAKEILSMDPSARIIVSSGYANNQVMAEYRESGLTGALQKPFTLKELKEKLLEVQQG